MLNVDTHAHIFETNLPLAPARRYAPDYDAKLEHYLAELDQHGIGIGLLVQPSFLGTDNSYLLAALRRSPRRLRGVVVIEPATPLSSLREMHAVGVTGIRLNLDGLPLPRFEQREWRTLLEGVRALGWHVEVHRDACDLPTLLPPLLEAGVKVVVDHFGRPDPLAPTADPGFRFLLDQAATGRIWVKLCAAYRNAGAGGPEHGERVALACTPALLAAFGPERLVWGSDWPHTRHESEVDFGAALEALSRWVPDAAARAAILQRAPAALFADWAPTGA